MNDRPAAPIAPPTLIEVLARHALEEPDRPALEFELGGSGSIRSTRAELGREVRALARLIARHTVPGDRVLIACPIGPDFLVAFLACLRVSAIAVPIHPPSQRAAELRRAAAIAADTAPRLVLTTAALRAAAQALVGCLPQTRYPVEVLTTCSAAELEQSDEWEPAVQPVASDIAFLQYTSGSTGNPKGVMISHANLVANLAGMQSRFHYTADTHGVHWLPPYHDMGLIGCFLLPLYVGFCSRAISPLHFMQRPVRWLRAISEGGEATTAAPTFGYAHCVARIRDEEMAQLDLSRWRVAVVGAEPIRSDVLEAFAAKFGRVGFREEAFYPSYGLAEATLMVSGGEVMSGPRRFRCDAFALTRGEAIEPQSSACRTLIACGRPLPGTTVTIAHPETGAPLPSGRIGEICITGPGVARGYWNGASSGAAAPLAADVLRTGDLGTLIDGELLVSGRCRDLLIVNGKNHHPSDLEQTMERMCSDLSPGRGAVFQDESGAICAVYEVKRDAWKTFDHCAAESALRAVVADDHGLVLRHTRFVRAGVVPVTSSGKIRRAECRRLFLEDSFALAGALDD